MAMEHLKVVRGRVLEGIISIPAIRATLAGKLDRRLYQAYLTNVFHYAQHSAQVIALAGARCARQHPALARYLIRHAEEELGHEQWALDDLTTIGVSSDDVRGTRPVPACAAMIGYEYYVAGQSNPVGLFGWLYTLESMGDDLGGRFAKVVGEGLGPAAAGRGVKFLAGHGVADHDHTAELAQVIGRHITDAGDRADVEQVADVVADLYVRMFQQIADELPA